MIVAAVIPYFLTIAPVKAVGCLTFDNSNPRDPAFGRLLTRNPVDHIRAEFSGFV